ncbi:MAG: hypothetical protein IJY74_03860, partial [Oscillospiraceae bacterium]|nr:hypothetical protein [Oscillospiraceae bacterium]
MKEIRWIAGLLAAAIGAGLLCSCGESVDEGAAEVTTIQTTAETSPASTKNVDGTTYATATLAEGVTTKAYASAPVNGTTTKAPASSNMKGKKLTAVSIQTPDIPVSAVRNMGVGITEDGATLSLNSNWKPITEYERTSETFIRLSAFPAILQYEETGSTCSIVMEDGCETDEAFGANTEESYISVFGSQFDEIEITGFEFIEVDSIDSIKVLGKVKAGGTEFDMMHLISNCTYKEKTISYMILDADGSLADFIECFEDDIM